MPLLETPSSKEGGEWQLPLNYICTDLAIFQPLCSSAQLYSTVVRSLLICCMAQKSFLVGLGQAFEQELYFVILL